MFKKPLSSIKTSAPLRSSDRRKLRQRVVQEYGISPELGDLLVPDGLMSQKIATHAEAPGIVYLSPSGDPLWFTIGKGSGDLIPTVYTLWKKYDLLPWVSTPVVLASGADLMVPDVVQASRHDISEKQLVGIVQHTALTSMRGPPLAVGRMAVNLAGAKKGKAIRVSHTWKDHLFDMGNKSDPPGEIKVQREGRADEDVPMSEPGEREAFIPNDPSNINCATLPLDESVSKLPTPAPSTPAFAKEEVSDILRVAVLQAIKTTLASLTSKSFPIPASTFYSSYVLPFRPAFVPGPSSDEQSRLPPSYPQIDIKHSSYKSFLAFFKSLDKQQVLSLKDTKSDALVMSVSGTHPDVNTHQPYTSLRDVQLKGGKEKREEEERSKVRKVEVKALWKPHTANGSARFFSERGFDTSALYTYSELKSMVDKYVATHQLTDPQDQSYVNGWMGDALLSIVSENGKTRLLKREEVVQRLCKKMECWYKVQAEGKDLITREGQLKPISVVVKTRNFKDRKRSTLVMGFEPFFLEGEAMAAELKRLCACATTVLPIPGEVSGLGVLLQGKQTNRVIEFLLSRGVPEKWIASADLSRKSKQGRSGAGRRHKQVRKKRKTKHKQKVWRTGPLLMKPDRGDTRRTPSHGPKPRKWRVKVAGTRTT